MRPTLLAGLTIVCALLAGCVKVRNGTAESDTTDRLICWADAIGVAMQAGDDVRAYRSLAEFVAAWKEKSPMTVAAVSADYKQSDVWGQPIELRILTYSDENKHVRILSRGKDGVSQDGEGDDLYVDVIVRKGSKPEFKVKGR